MKSKKTRIAIIGIGGIGGYLGYKLASYYNQNPDFEIVFIQRGQHYEAINKNGLTYITKTVNNIKPNQIYQTLENMGIYDIIIFCVKSKDLENAVKSIKENINSETVLIPIMNGINNDKRIKKIIPDSKVLNACIYVSAAIQKPGEIKQTGGAGMLYIGTNTDIENYRKIEQLFINAGIKTTLTNDIETEVWKKYIFIASLATITSYTELTIGEIITNKQQKMQWICLMRELVALAKSEGILLPDSLIDENIERAETIPANTKTSMQQDIEKQKHPEFDIFVEYPVKQAQNLGIHLSVYNEYYARLRRKLNL